MLKNQTVKPTVMEFTAFKKKDHVTDDELLQAVIQFEEAFLSQQKGVLFHCLVRNYKNEYANVIFADNMDTLNEMVKHIEGNVSVSRFFDLIDNKSVRMNFHQIQKSDFEIPTHFTCIECGTFKLQTPLPLNHILKLSDTIEQQYLNKTENTQGHFIGTISDEVYSEITFGKTFAKTKEICLGYVGNPYCQPLLNIADPKSMDLDFWYLIG